MSVHKAAFETESIGVCRVFLIPERENILCILITLFEVLSLFVKENLRLLHGKILK